jgi:hypothetical protein
MSDFERELEQELHRVLDPMTGQSIPPRRPVQPRRATRTLIGGAGAALAVKVLGGVAVAAAAVTLAGVATTDSLNPTDWGRHVKHQISTDAPAPRTTTGNTGNTTNGNGDTNGSSNSSGGSGTGNPGGKHLASPESQPTAAPPQDLEPNDPVGTYPPVLISPPPYIK